MNATARPGNAQLARPSAVPSDPIADELRRYDDHLRDVRGLSAGTRHDRCQYVEADLAMKERALARLHEPEAKLRRYRAPDSLIDFLRAL